MSVVRINTEGEIDLVSVNALSREELREWFRNRLHGRDATVPPNPRSSEMPHYLFAELYPRLVWHQREDLQSVLLTFLREILRDPESTWRGEAGDELLMLVDPVLLESPRRDEALSLLLGIIEAVPPSVAGEPDIHFRALQAMVALRHRTDAGFWHRQFELGGDPYVLVVLDGLALIDPAAVFDWLASVAFSEAVEDGVACLLPSLLEDYGVRTVKSLITTYLPRP